MISFRPFADKDRVVDPVSGVFIRFGACFIKVCRAPRAVLKYVELPVCRNCEGQSESLAVRVEQLERHGPQRSFPRSDRIRLGKFVAVAEFCHVGRVVIFVKGFELLQCEGSAIDREDGA